MWLIDPMTYAVDRRSLDGGAAAPDAATADGGTSLQLGVAVVRTAGPGLRIVDGDTRYER